MQAKIDFTNLTLTTPSFDHKLIREGAGHLRLQLENDPVIVDPYTLSKDFVKTSPRKDLSVNHTKTADHDNVGDTKTATPPENPERHTGRPDQSTVISLDQVKKLHLQFNHALAPAMIKIIKAANMKADEDHIHTVIENCGCHVPHNRPQKTKVSGIRAQFPGQVIHLDVFFPSLTNPQKNPFLMIVDSFSRFTMTRKLFGPSAQSGPKLLQCFVANWVSAYGVPETVYSDAGTVFTHSLWHEWSELYGVKIVPASARSQWQNGLCERTIDTIKQVTHRLLVKNKETNLK